MSAPQTVPDPVASGQTVNADNPWPGLLAFREADQQFFQGRRAETEDLCRLVMRERLVVLFGLSGLGKSSLLQAGLFPYIRRENVFPVYVRLDFSQERPDLIAGIKDQIKQQAAAAGIEAPAARSGETLWEYLHRNDNDFWNRRQRPMMPLLVFDQFEEIFTLGRLSSGRSRARESLVEQLADLAEGRPPAALKVWLDEHPDEVRAFTFGRHYYKVLLTLREDFLPDLESLRQRMPALVLHRIRLRPMNGEAALMVVSQARDLIAPDVAEQVVRFVSADRRGRALADLEVEPALLSVVCRELNNQRIRLGEPSITAGLLEGSQDEVLHGFYERSVGDLPLEVREFIEERLLTASGYRDSVALENALGIPGVTADAIDLLVERRLVRKEDRGSGGQRLELTHDLLTSVVQASRDRRRLLEAAEKERRALIETREREKGERAVRDAQRIRRAAVVFLVLTLVAVGAAVWAIRAQHEANIQRALAQVQAEHAKDAAIKADYNAGLAVEKAKDASHAAEDAQQQREFARSEQKQAQVSLSRASVQDAALLAESGQMEGALAHMAVALRLEPDSWNARSWLASILISRNFWLPRPPLRHSAPVIGLSLSKDGRLLVTASADAAQVWDPATGQTVGAPMRHSKTILRAAMSANGKRVVTASADGTARIWDALTGAPASEPLQHGGEVLWAAITADGRRVVTASADGTARIWDPGKSSETLELGKPVRFAAFSPNERLLVTASGDEKEGMARLWDAASHKPVGEPMLHQKVVRWAAFSSDGQFLATASEDSTVGVWRTDSGKAFIKPLRSSFPVMFVTWAPSGYQILSVGEGEGRMWWGGSDGVTSKSLTAYGVDSAAFSPDGISVVTASRDGTTRIFVNEGGRPGTFEGTWKPYGPPMQHQGPVRDAVFSSDGRRLITASDDSTVRIWESDAGKPSVVRLEHQAQDRMAQGYESQVVTAAFSGDGRRVVTGLGEGSARAWDALTGQQLHFLRPIPRGSVKAFSRDGKHVLIGAGPNAADFDTAQVYDIDTGLPVGDRLKHDRNSIGSCAFSPDGKYVVTSPPMRATGEKARVWNAATGKLVGSPISHEATDYFRMTFSPDSRHIVVLPESRAAQVWDIVLGKAVGKPLRHPKEISSATFSPNGRRLLTTSTDGTARVWDVETGEPVGSPLQQQPTLFSGKFSPDGTRLFLDSSSPLPPQIMQVGTGVPVGAPLGAQPLAFSPEGRRVASIGSGGARIWHADTGKPSGLPMTVPGSSQGQDAIFSPEGRRLLTRSGAVVQIWTVLLGSAADSGLLADMAEAVGGLRLNEFGSPVPLGLDEQVRRLDAFRSVTAQRLAKSPQDDLTRFLAGFFGVSPKTVNQPPRP